MPAISSTLGSVPTPTIATSASMRRPPLVTTRLEPAVALEARHRLVEEHLHPVVAMQRLDRPAEVGAEHPVQGGLEDLHDRDVDAERAQRRRDLGADEPHADADDPRAAGGGLA